MTAKTADLASADLGVLSKKTAADPNGQRRQVSSLMRDPDETIKA
ncbi:hypothetical protein [Phaeobacter italicus]|nr:hypothetical protein [Phaeobacter italicus]